jgi:hypothetical protein
MFFISKSEPADDAHGDPNKFSFSVQFNAIDVYLCIFSS